jgi:hypothetical protein
MKRFVQAWATLVATLTVAGQPGEIRLTPISPDVPFSFVVFGDNRGDESGQQPPAFTEVLAAIQREAPSLILDSGDMIYGHTRDAEELEAQWRIYRQTINSVHVPIFHVPGNHDLWNAASAQVYRGLWGAPHYAFTYGNCRFIGLDTETAPERLDEGQFKWLEAELQACRLPNVFLFMHRPLFPVDGGIGSSLDAYPEQRDRLHRLFVQHAQIIRAVFTGHEHLYSYQERDGIRYYTSGGGGAPLYMAPERGGFHHFLKVSVAGSHVEVGLHKVCAPSAALLTPKKINPGDVLETWNRGMIWYAWDRSASVEITDANASQGARSLRLNFDLTQYAWPVLVLPFVSPRDFSHTSSLYIDIFVPRELNTQLDLVLAAQGVQKHEAPPVALKPGWNSVRTELDPSWLPVVERSRIQTLEWSLSAKDPRGSGYLLFDNLRIQREGPAAGRQPELLESWERPLLWRVFDESVPAQIRDSATPETAGLSVRLDGPKSSRPLLFAQLNPPWDLTNVRTLFLKATPRAPVSPDLLLELVLRANDTDFIGPSVRFQPGAPALRFDLNPSWLPDHVRTNIEQIAFRLVTNNTTGPVELVFKQLSAAENL